MALVHIILVNWNGWQDTLECVESLLRMNDDRFCITVCDNGSTNDSIALLTAGLQQEQRGAWSSQVWSELPVARRLDCSVAVLGRHEPAPDPSPRIRVVTVGENLGFAGGNNIGIDMALADPECAFVWLLNNDTVVTPGALAALLDAMDQRAQVAICGSTLLFYHKPEAIQALGGWYRLALARGGHLGSPGRRETLPNRESVERDMAYVVGASMFVRRAVFERTGGLSEDYFLYFEELDLAHQLLPNEKQGWSPQAIVFHKEGGSIGTSSISRPSDTSLYYIQINTLRFYRKFHAWLLPLGFLRIAREALAASRKGDRAALRIAKLAVLDFITGVTRTGAITSTTGR